MTDTRSYPYVTHLDIKFPALDLIDVEALAKSVTDQWYNQTLCRVNDSVVRLGVMQGEYHWHKHDNDDEFFFVLSGRFIVDLEARSIELLPGQWPAPGSEDTELSVFMGPEVSHGETTVYAGVQA